MTLVATYCSLQDVRRQLRSVSHGGRIRFSESFNELRPDSDNTGTVELFAIGVSLEYADVATYRFQFASDSSSFTMYKVDTEKATEVPLGSGLKQQNFTSSDGNFQVDATSWTGFVFPEDSVRFQTDSHIATHDGTRFIQDAERFVDTVLERNIRFVSRDENLRFPLDSTSPIPKAVQLATQKIAAYFIYKAAYLEQQVERTSDSIAIGWMREGLELLAGYVDKHNLSLVTSAPMLGHAGTNLPVDLNNDFVFKSSVWNLRIPIAQLFHDGPCRLAWEACDFVDSDQYSQSVASDIESLAFGHGFY